MSGSRISNEAVGAGLGRLFRRNRSQEEQDILEAYRTQTPVDEIRRRRAAAAAPAPRAPMTPPDEATEARSRSDSAMSNMAGPDEVAEANSRRRAERNVQRPNTRMRPSASREMSADDLNALMLERLGKGSEGVPEGPDAAIARARIAQATGMKKGGKVKKMAKGGAVKAGRGDGCAARGKTKGRMV